MFDDHTATQPRGRPSLYTDEISEEICRRLAGGESLRAICRSESMPHVATVLRWLPAHPEFRDQYARAREAQAECFVDQIINIADSVANERESSIVHAARLRIDARRWAASKMAPRKYGDKLDLESSGTIVVKLVRGLGDEE